MKNESQGLLSNSNMRLSIHLNLFFHDSMHGHCTKAEQNSELAKTVLALIAEIISIIIQEFFFWKPSFKHSAASSFWVGRNNHWTKKGTFRVFNSSPSDGSVISNGACKACTLCLLIELKF